MIALVRDPCYGSKIHNPSTMPARMIGTLRVLRCCRRIAADVVAGARARLDDTIRVDERRLLR